MLLNWQSSRGLGISRETNTAVCAACQVSNSAVVLQNWGVGEVPLGCSIGGDCGRRQAGPRREDHPCPPRRTATAQPQITTL